MPLKTFLETLITWVFKTNLYCFPCSSVLKMSSLNWGTCLSPFRLLAQATVDWTAYKQPKFISHGSGGWKAKMEPLADWVSGENQLPGSQTAPPHRVLTPGRGKAVFWGPFKEELIPWLRTLPSLPNHIPKDPPPNTVILGIRFAVQGFGMGAGHEHSV